MSFSNIITSGSNTGSGDGTGLYAAGGSQDPLVREFLRGSMAKHVRSVHFSYGVTRMGTDKPNVGTGRLLIIEGPNHEELKPWSTPLQGQILFDTFVSEPGSYNIEFPRDVADGAVMGGEGSVLTVVLTRFYSDLSTGYYVGGGVNVVWEPVRSPAGQYVGSVR